MTAASYFIDNKSIASIDSTKDLGIIITQNLTWESHYKLISGKAYKILGLIFSGNRPVETRKKLYISLVCAQILYCSQVWRPYLIKNINMLERIQRPAVADPGGAQGARAPPPLKKCI